MRLFDWFKKQNTRIYAANDGDEFCPRCDANLTLQKGYHHDLPYWVCLGCGEMLINPRIKGDVIWRCDQCEDLLNEQPGFTEDCSEWQCTKCGFSNLIDDSQIYLSDEEKKAAFRECYNGMSDEDVIAVMSYEELGNLGNRDDIVIVKNEDGERFVKKILETFDESVYRYLLEHPVNRMPKIISVHKGLRHLIVFEEYVEGITLDELLDDRLLSPVKAVQITRDICLILRDLHTLKSPIIHRDVKPSNVMLTKEFEIVLLDVNVAKWYRPEETEDTRMLGTKYFAAPEQLGYGFAASTAKTDIYALGMLLNMLITGKLPKKEKAPDDIWPIVEKCIRLVPEERYSDDELITVLNHYLETQNEELTGNKVLNHYLEEYNEEHTDR